MAKVKWILTCDMDCPKSLDKRDCPHKCYRAEYERDYLNTELPKFDEEDDNGR